MSISTLYVLDVFGKPIVSRDYRDSHGPEVINKFMLTMLEKEEEQTLTPVIKMEDTTFAFVKYKNIYVVATVIDNASILLVFVFLHKIINIMCDYFKELQEESIKDNLVVMHELLDEVLDFGYPQTTDSKILMEYITQESKKLNTQKRIPPAVTNTVSWRPEGIKYKNNEVFLDVIESVDLVANGCGTVVRSEIVGSLTFTTKLSGMPQMQMGLNDRLLHEKSTDSHPDYLVDLDDVKFHHCVRLCKFESDRIIMFVPPDGEFELMTYRMNTYVKPPIWVDCITEYYDKKRVQYTVKASSYFKSRLTATFVHILIPVPSDVDTPLFKTGYGIVSYVPERNLLKWSFKLFPGLKEFNMTASFKLPSVANEEREPLPPIHVEFEIPFFAISGIHVQHMKVMEKSGYSSVIWVRYITKNGDYQIRQKEVIYKK